MVYSGFLNFTQQAGSLVDHDEVDEEITAAPLKQKDIDLAAERANNSVPVISRRKAFLLVEKNFTPAHDNEFELVDRFSTRSQDAILSFVSGTDHFHTWKRDDLRSALQSGVTKLLGALDLLIIDDGLDYGLSRLIGTAIHAEEEYRSHTAAIGQPRRPPINYLGVVPLRKLAVANELVALHQQANGSDFNIVPGHRAGPSSDSWDLSRHHSHYVIFDEPYAAHRAYMEKQLQGELAIRQTRKFANDNSSDFASGNGVAFVPHVVVFFQGGPDELDVIRAYIDARVPVIVMDGCGGMSDVLAAGIRSGLEPDPNRLHGILGSRLVGSFPDLKHDEQRLENIQDRLYQIVRKAAPPAGLSFIVDCNMLNTFDSLDVPILQAIIKSSAEKNPTWEQLVTNFKLCVACNRPDIAAGFLLSAPPWVGIPNKVPYPGMMAALAIPGREGFVDMLLQQLFPLRFLFSHLDLLTLYRTAQGKNYFIAMIWDDILGHNQTDPIEEDFLLVEMNPLIHQLTGVRNYLNFYEMSRIALTGDDSFMAPAQADSNALDALIVFAVLLNRPQLVKVLLKYASDPIPSTVFVETMYRGMYRSTNDMELRAGLKRQADDFGKMATEILDAGIRESPHRAKTFFQRPVPSYNDKTTLEMAFDARNRTFISHPLVQNWLDQFGNGFIRVKGAHQELKMVLSAYLFFPMYLWLSFPKHTEVAGQQYAGQADMEYFYDPRSKKDALASLRTVTSTKTRSVVGTGNVAFKEKYPPFPNMVYAVWSAPIVKYWTWFIIYHLFLIVIGTDMMMPACTNLGLDIAVFVLTALIWLELLLRTVYDIVWKRRTDYYLRATDLIYQTVFNVLFFLYRLAPYRYDHPFAGRVILAFGVMYYFYSVWLMFYMFNRQLGPLVRIVMIMFKQDLPKWFIMMLPFFVSSMVIWQSIITPDFPFTGEDWRKAFYRAIFTLFGTFAQELEYNDACENNNLINWSNFTQPAQAYPADRCWLGDYNSYTCNTVSFWAYFFVINYFFFLKLGMIIILVVFYIFRQSVEMPKADLIWRYERFQALFEYYWRSSLPFPLNIFGNIYLIFSYCGAKRKDMEAKSDPELADLKMDTFFYWKGIAAEYFARQAKADGARAVPMKQTALLGAVKGGIQSIVGRFSEMEKKLGDIDDNTRRLQLNIIASQPPPLPIAENKWSRPGSVTSGLSMDISAVAAPNPHIRSRQSPYKGTHKERLPVPSDKVSWEEFMDNYNPGTYTRPLEAFRPDVQPFVDPAIEILAATHRKDWNTIEYDDDGQNAVVRRTWITDQNGHPLIYRLDVNGLPLNPRGRTGLRGRGEHCRYGPNHGVILAITTSDKRLIKFVVQWPTGDAPTLPNVPLCQYDSEYAVAAILMDSIFNDANPSIDYDFDPATVKTEDDLREVVPILLKYQHVRESIDDPPVVRVTEMYRGYWDAPINTDNAWMEVLVLHIVIPPARIDPDSVYHWKTYSTRDLGLTEFDTAIMKNVQL